MVQHAASGIHLPGPVDIHVLSEFLRHSPCHADSTLPTGPVPVERGLATGCQTCHPPARGPWWIVFAHAKRCLQPSRPQTSIPIKSSGWRQEGEAKQRPTHLRQDKHHGSSRPAPGLNRRRGWSPRPLNRRISHRKCPISSWRSRRLDSPPLAEAMLSLPSAFCSWLFDILRSSVGFLAACPVNPSAKRPPRRARPRRGRRRSQRGG